VDAETTGRFSHSIGEVQGTLAVFMEEQRNWNSRIDAKLDKFNDRVGHLEQKAAVSGAIGGSLSGALVSLAVGLALAWLSKGQ
jgi:hypothetical protein